MTDAEIYLQHLDQIVGRAETTVHQLDSLDPALQKVAVFVYDNWPREGFITGFTYGLSFASHPDWRFGRPELIISVESLDPSWPYAAAYLANTLRGKCPFCYGNTINFREKISQDSNFDAFLVFAPPYLTNEQKAVKLNSFTCNITGLYPMYSSELPLYEELGIEKFWHLPGWDPLNVQREPLA